VLNGVLWALGTGAQWREVPENIRRSRPAVASSTSDTELVLTSTVDGADIEIDGAFAGNTPSTVQVSAGDHTICIWRKGYQTYEKQIHVSGGKINLRAELETVKE
jgi:hypothetical protein